MKNIHVLPTNKPSRFVTSKENKICYLYSIEEFKDIDKFIEYDSKSWDSQNIYITSDEEIKEGDWYLSFLRDKFEVINYLPNGGYRKECLGKEVCKIILTTDQDLIEEGVQAIDDEFLEWFVNNPSCEEIMLWRFHGINTSIAEVNAISGDGSLNWQGKDDLRDYKIIIPKEESFIEYTNTNDCTSMIYNSKEEPKQEKMYSEEEVEMIANKMVNLAIDNIGNPFYEYHDSFNKPAFTEVLEQFKNK